MQDFFSFFITVIFLLIGLMIIISAFKSAIISYKKRMPFIKYIIFTTSVGLTIRFVGLLNYFQVIDLFEFFANILDKK